MGSAVPGMDGGILGHQIHLAPGAHLLGEIRVLHIHEVALVKAAHRLEGAGAHTGKAAGAELDLDGPGQVLIQHQVVVVLAFPEAEPGQLAVEHGPQGAPTQGQLLGLAVREHQRRPGHHGIRVGGHPVGQITQGISGQLDIRVEDKVEIAVQLGQDHIVAGAKAAVLGAAVHHHLLARACCQQAVRHGLLQLFAAAVRAGIVHQIQGHRVAACAVQHRLRRLQRLVIAVIYNNTG